MLVTNKRPFLRDVWPLQFVRDAAIGRCIILTLWYWVFYDQWQVHIIAL